MVHTAGRCSISSELKRSDRRSSHFSFGVKRYVESLFPAICGHRLGISAIIRYNIVIHRAQWINPFPTFRKVITPHSMD